MTDVPFISKETLVVIEKATNRRMFPDLNLELWVETEHRPQPGDVIHIGSTFDPAAYGIKVDSCRMVITTEVIQYLDMDERLDSCRSKYNCSTVFLVTGEIVPMLRHLPDCPP